MSTYVLMRILESAPSRYDKGIEILTLGQLDAAYDRLANQAERGQTILDLGCGTGALTLRAALRGARVKGIDVNAQMLEIAQTRVEEASLAHSVELLQMGVAELGSEEEENYDAVMSGLCFSELTDEELTYALGQIKRVLKPGGLLLLADEVRPKSPWKRLLTAIMRCPLVMVAYLITQTTTRAAIDLPRKVEEAGLRIDSLRLNRTETFIELVARKP